MSIVRGIFRNIRDALDGDTVDPISRDFDAPDPVFGRQPLQDIRVGPQGLANLETIPVDGVERSVLDIEAELDANPQMSKREQEEAFGAVLEDGDLYAEIDDSPATFLNNISQPNEAAEATAFRLEKMGTQPLGSVVSHPKFFKAYPQAADVKVKFRNEPKSRIAGGLTFDGGNLVVNLGHNTFKDINTGKLDTDKVMSTVLHEMQHVAQIAEGRTGGGNAEGMLANMLAKKKKISTDPNPKNASERLARNFDELMKIRSDMYLDTLPPEEKKGYKDISYVGYLRLRDEAEARNVQFRYEDHLRRSKQLKKMLPDSPPLTYQAFRKMKKYFSDTMLQDSASKRYKLDERDRSSTLFDVDRNQGPGTYKYTPYSID